MRSLKVPVLIFVPFLFVIASSTTTAASIVQEHVVAGETNLDTSSMDNDHRFNLDNSGGFDVVRCDTCPVSEVVDLATETVLWRIDPALLGVEDARLVGFADLDDDGIREAVVECAASVSPPGLPLTGSCEPQVLVVDPSVNQIKLRLQAAGEAYSAVFLGDVDHDSADELVVLHSDGTTAVTEIYGSGNTTSVGLEDLAATYTDGAVRLVWRFSESPVRELVTVGVQRSDRIAGPYADVSRSAMAPAVRMQFEDVDVEVGMTYWYRLELVRVDGARSTSAPVGVVAGTAAPAPVLDVATLSSAEGSLEIHYRVSGHSARLSIYDVTGRLVRLLANDVRAPGEHVATWNRTNESGSPVARGVYLVQLETDELTVSKKVVLAHR